MFEGIRVPRKCANASPQSFVLKQLPIITIRVRYSIGTCRIKSASVYYTVENILYIKLNIIIITHYNAIVKIVSIFFF